MINWLWAVVAFAAVVAVLAGTGRWRILLAPFGIRPRRMTVARLGLGVTTVADTDRVNNILRHFAAGFNRTLTAPSIKAGRRFCATLPALYRPFAEEGLAMAYTPHRLFRYRPEQFEDRIVRPAPEFRYLYYVGLGFWSGMRNHTVKKLATIVADLDPLHRFLCYDGYGFKVAFFDHPSDPSALQRLDLLPGYARNAAYQGVGRALYFRYLNRPDLMFDQVAAFGDQAADAAAGIGLAAVFVQPDHLDAARTLAEKVPAPWRAHFHLGMCFGLKARSINDLDAFEQHLSKLETPVADAVRVSIRECDRIELLIRSEPDDNGYRTWRRRVTLWIADNIDYPFAGVRSTTRAKPPSRSRSLRLGRASSYSAEP